VGILETLLNEIESNDVDQQVREICDKIFDEEKEKGNIKHFNNLPSGPNIFLALEVPGRTKEEVAFLALEREMSQRYIIVLWTNARKKGLDNMKRSKATEIRENEAGKIVKEYVKIFKFMKGE